jgi:hypothetical protein
VQYRQQRFIKVSPVGWEVQREVHLLTFCQLVAANQISQERHLGFVFSFDKFAKV